MKIIISILIYASLISFILYITKRTKKGLRVFLVSSAIILLTAFWIYLYGDDYKNLFK